MAFVCIASSCSWRVLHCLLLFIICIAEVISKSFFDVSRGFSLQKISTGVLVLDNFDCYKALENIHCIQLEWAGVIFV